MRLRDKGWSYRRIAETLQVQYVLVSQWLSGIDQPLVRPREAADEDGVSAVGAVVRAASADLRALADRYDRLERRIEGMARDIEDLKSAMASLTAARS